MPAAHASSLGSPETKSTLAFWAAVWQTALDHQGTRCFTMSSSIGKVLLPAAYFGGLYVLMLGWMASSVSAAVGVEVLPGSMVACASLVVPSASSSMAGVRLVICWAVVRAAALLHSTVAGPCMCVATPQHHIGAVNVDIRHNR